MEIPLADFSGPVFKQAAMRVSRVGVAVAVLLSWACVVAGWAQPTPEDNPRMKELKSVVDGLKYQKGEVDLKGGLAHLRLPENLRFLGPNDAEKVIVDIWGNPPGGEKPLGLIIPDGMSPIDDNAWAVIVQYEEDGYVKDDEAAKINYTELLATMKKDVKKANEVRAKEGYSTVELIGWATPPHYDAQAKKLYWAKELKFGGADESTLNYNIRILGRRGVLVLNAVANISQLAEIEQASPAILSAVEFKEGHRYADFNASTDKVASYGIAALVAGGVLAKTGFFKMILAALIAGKKFVIIAVVAVAGFLKKLFGKKE